jgi:hypothetical protein
MMRRAFWISLEARSVPPPYVDQLDDFGLPWYCRLDAAALVQFEFELEEAKDGH